MDIRKILREWFVAGGKRRLSFAEARAVADYAEHNPDDYIRMYREESRNVNAVRESP